MIFFTSVQPTACVISQDNYLPNQESQTEKKDFKTDTATIKQVTNLDERVEENDEEENRMHHTCTFELPSRFTSIQELEIGLGLEGVILGNWSVKFNENETYEWNYSDITEFGNFYCNENSISYSSNEGVHQSVYDIQSEILHWADVEYQLD